MRAASSPRRARAMKLLVVDASGRVSHHRRLDLMGFVRPGDLVVANDAATLPASLGGVHVPTQQVIEVRLAGRRSLSGDAVAEFTVVTFGAGDHRMPTEARPAPPPLHEGDELRFGTLRAHVVGRHAHPRLVDIRFDAPPAAIWEALARHGRPIQYSYVREPVAIWDTWTGIASRPVAFEAPSAGFVLDWATIRALQTKGASFATLTHAAGISSTGDAALDRLLPLDEPYFIPPATARLVANTKAAGGRVIAIGTTVVRALEDAARAGGRIVPGEGVATGRIGPHTPLHVVDAIVSGMHEPGTSHYELLRAFQDDGALARMTEEAEAGEYEGHEYGDASLIIRAAS